MKVAHITFPNNVIEEVNNVHHVDFRPTHVVIYTKDGHVVAYRATEVITIVTQEID